jgi:transcription elongation factor Elf1
MALESYQPIWRAPIGTHMQVTLETEVTCPFCGEPNSILVECSADSQVYIEDCSVCCNPIRFNIQCAGGELISIEAERES